MKQGASEATEDAEAVTIKNRLYNIQLNTDREYWKPPKPSGV